MFTFISDGQALLFVLVLLYLAECLIWVKKQSVAFVSTLGRRWRVATPVSWLGNANGALLVLNPLPPPGRVFLSHLLPVSISPSGVCAFNSQTLPSGARPATQTGEFVGFAEIRECSADGAYLVINGEKFAKCATPKQAKALAKVIAEVKAAKSSRREALVRSWVSKQFDAKEASGVWHEAEGAIGLIRWMCAMFFVYLFVAAPIVVTFYGLERLIIQIGATMVVLAIVVAIMFFRTHRRFYPAETQERLENFVKMILCPPVSLRAADVLTKHLLSEYSPVVVASVLAGPGSTSGSSERQFVRSFVLDLQHPLKHESTDEKAVETIDWMNAEQLQACLKHVERAGYESLLGPTQREGDSVSYCPRCGVQFVVADGECPDCPGVELVAFADHVEEVTLSQTSG